MAPGVKFRCCINLWSHRFLPFTAKGRLSSAAEELRGLEAIAADQSLKDFRVTFSRNGAQAILEIAVEVLAGEMAAGQKNYAEAIARLHRAVLLEDNLIYNEPPDWHVPARQSLGAVLLTAGRAAEAESIYWQDLQRNTENGWSLFGLMMSLRAQEKGEQARAVEKRFRKAWNQADVRLTASRFMDATRTAVASSRTGSSDLSP
jgi:Flp pilus assembly protein TadD